MNDFKNTDILESEPDNPAPHGKPGRGKRTG
jgi:hypothetical protein